MYQLESLIILTKLIMDSRTDGSYFQYSVTQSSTKSRSQIANRGPGGDIPRPMSGSPQGRDSQAPPLLLVF